MTVALGVKGPESRAKIRARVRVWSKSPEQRAKTKARRKKLYASSLKTREAKHAANIAFYAKNKERVLAANARYRKRNRERIRHVAKVYARRIRSKRLEYDRNRRAANVGVRLRGVLRSRVSHALGGRSKAARTMELLGCSIENFKIYLESRFEVGMSWANYGKGKGKWHIDHIMPCAIFDLTQQSHQKRCFHFSNQQPMWEPDNMRKHTKITNPQFMLL